MEVSMKFLVLGATGMAGHTIAIYLSEQGHEVTTFSRTAFPFGNNISGDSTDEVLLQSILSKDDYDGPDQLHRPFKRSV